MEIGPLIGKKLAALMEQRSLTQVTLATDAGVSQPTISGLVSGATKDPPLGTILRIAAALEIDVLDLLPNPDELELEPEPGAPFGAYDRSKPLVARPKSVGARVDALQREVADLNDRLGLALDRIGRLEDGRQPPGTQRRPS